jgi:uncharacterized protein (DUF362 family)
MGKPKVSVVKAKKYGEETEKAIEQAVDLIGGIKETIHRGDIVLVKPNMVHPQTGESGHVTHWSLVKKLIEMCHAAGASRIIVGDGSADGNTLEAFETSGLKKVVDDFNSSGVSVELVDLNHDKNPETGDFDAVDVGKDGSNPNHIYRVAHSVLVADAIVSVPKIKSHNGTGITISLKNMIGTAPGGYYGFPKKKGHIEALPHSSSSYDYGNISTKNMLAKYDIIWRTIIDLNMIARGRYPDSPKKRDIINVVDGVVAGSYNYRSTEIAIWDPVEVGVIVAGFDSVAVDTVCSRIMCYRPERIPLLANAAKNGLGNIDSIEIIGEKIESVKNYVPPADVWLSIVDKRMPSLWPRLVYQSIRQQAVQIATKPSVYSLREKVGLVRRMNH